jgi:hypothetical protein
MQKMLIFVYISGNRNNVLLFTLLHVLFFLILYGLKSSNELFIYILYGPQRVKERRSDQNVSTEVFPKIFFE